MNYSGQGMLEQLDLGGLETQLTVWGGQVIQDSERVRFLSALQLAGGRVTGPGRHHPPVDSHFLSRVAESSVLLD